MVPVSSSIILKLAVHRYHVIAYLECVWNKDRYNPVRFAGVNLMKSALHQVPRLPWRGIVCFVIYSIQTFLSFHRTQKKARPKEVNATISQIHNHHNLKL